VLLALSLSAAMSGGAMAATHSVSAGTFVLKKSDVPRTFTSKTNYTRSIAVQDAPVRYGVKLKTLTREGRVDGFESAFSRPYKGKKTPDGLYGVADEVTQFTSTSGAQWFFSHVKKAAYPGHTEVIPTIGNDRVAETTRPLKGSRTARITFRHGDFVVTVTTTYLGTADPLPDALHYAQIIDHRLTAHSE
jgi:hypothetical protein